jgi:site-specific DNA-methyltransferase (cytosine-N4-specific)
MTTNTPDVNSTDLSSPKVPECALFDKKRINSVNNIIRNIVSQDWNFTDYINGKGLYNLHPYPAKFISQIPRKIIEYLEIPKTALIFDPFCGSGTSIIAAKELGYKTFGVDLNPIATLITKVATYALPSQFEENFTSLKKRYKTQVIEKLPYIPNIDHWFKKEIQMEIEKIYQSILQDSSLEIQNIFFLALSSIIVKISNQESDTRYAAVEKNIGGQDVFPLFLRMVESYEEILKQNNNFPLAKILTSDSLSLNDSYFDKEVGLTITSPPYPNAYEYWLYHKYRMYWLRFDPL